MAHESNEPPMVLVAEDDATSLLLIRRTLQRWGYEVTAARDGAQALELLQQRPVRLVISDWEMPELDGPGLCRALRQLELGRYVYFVMLTSRQSRESLVQGLEAGADDFLVKPFDPDELRVRLQVGQRVLQLEEDLQQKTRELEALNKHLADKAATDHLTGIGNRRSFEEALARAHALAQRQQVPFGVVMLDVDRFKRYNDHYGHQAGDEVLSRVAGALVSSVRASDELFRYGGEEFVIISGHQSAEGLAAMAERLRCAVEQLAIEHQQSELGRVTVSLGAALLTPQSAAELAPAEQVVQRADQALYRAKEGGRNRVVLADD